MLNFLNVYTNVFVRKYVGRFFIYLQKRWRAGHINLKFGMWSNQILLLKKLENSFFIRAALLGANISQIFSQLGSAEIFGLWYRGLCSTGPLNSFIVPFRSLIELQLILRQFQLLQQAVFNSYPNIDWKWNCKGENSQLFSSEITLAWENESQGHHFGQSLYLHVS